MAAGCSSAEGSEGAASSAVSFVVLAGGLRDAFLAVVAFLVRVLAAAGVSLAAAISERSGLLLSARAKCGNAAEMLCLLQLTDDPDGRQNYRFIFRLRGSAASPADLSVESVKGFDP